MPIVAQCPTCGVSLRVPDSAAGRTINCPKCRHALTVLVDASEDVAVELCQPAELPSVVAADEFCDCPYCGEQIKATARKCKHCKEHLDQPLAEVEPADAVGGAAVDSSAAVANSDDRPWWQSAWDYMTKKECPLCKESRGQTTHEVIIKTTDGQEWVTKWRYVHGRGAMPRVQKVVMRTVVYDEFYRCEKCDHKWSERLTRKSEVGLVRLLWERFNGEKPEDKPS
jgi:hypothetical protein